MANLSKLVQSAAEGSICEKICIQQMTILQMDTA